MLLDCDTGPGVTPCHALAIPGSLFVTEDEAGGAGRLSPVTRASVMIDTCQPPGTRESLESHMSPGKMDALRIL